MNFGEDVLDLPKKNPAPPVKAHTAGAAVKEFRTEMGFEYFDAVGDGRGRDAEFACGASETFVSGCRLETGEAFKWEWRLHGDMFVSG